MIKKGLPYVPGFILIIVIGLVALDGAKRLHDHLPHARRQPARGKSPVLRRRRLAGAFQPLRQSVRGVGLLPAGTRRRSGGDRPARRAPPLHPLPRRPARLRPALRAVHGGQRTAGRARAGPGHERGGGLPAGGALGAPVDGRNLWRRGGGRDDQNRGAAGGNGRILAREFGRGGTAAGKFGGGGVGGVRTILWGGIEQNL
jgi:hypothetical protein